MVLSRPAGRQRACHLLTMLAIIALTVSGCTRVRATALIANPLLPSGPDPWIIQHDGYYYFTSTQGNRISLRRTRALGHLAESPATVVWRAPADGPGSASVWAPELHFLDGKWFIYFAAADKAHDDDAHRRIYVLETVSRDPTKGSWRLRGRLKVERPGIDPTVFRLGGKLYFIYSAYVGDHSDLVIAPMVNPWTLGSPQVDIARPTHAWEMHGGRRILEGPAFLEGPTGKLFITYSASACWSDHYALGMLTANAGADPLNAKSWHKTPQPVFKSDPKNAVYAPGGNGFFKSPDGSQTWIVYHANGGPGWGCGQRRSPRVQPIHWRVNGTPDFGVPVRAGVLLPAPSDGAASGE